MGNRKKFTWQQLDLFYQDNKEQESRVPYSKSQIELQNPESNNILKKPLDAVAAGGMYSFDKRYFRVPERIFLDIKSTNALDILVLDDTKVS